jgi:Two component regulator propeller.
MLDIHEQSLRQFEGHSSYFKSSINNNIIKDIYIDKQRRIWMAVFPFGITISQPQNFPFERIEHLDHNDNSLVDNQVNYIFEDSDKDIWFLTNNGVSYFNKNKNKWTNFLYSTSNNEQQGTRVFLSMIEVVPGKFILSGYMAGIYFIDKKKKKLRYFPVKDNIKFSSDKYISSIYNDEKDVLWLGGYSYLKRYNTRTNMFSFFNMNTPISHISKKKLTMNYG